MTLTIHKEENEQRELKLTVEVSEDRVEKAMRSNARELGRDMRFPGFRRGKVPYRVIVQRVGRETLRAEAIEGIVQAVYAEAMEEAEVEPYGQPVLDDLNSEPLELKFTIPLPPIVTLGAYRELRGEIDEVTVTEEAVEEALEQIQVKHQTVEDVERAVETGDLITVSGKGEVAAKTVDEAQAETAEADEQVDTAEADEQVDTAEADEQVETAEDDEQEETAEDDEQVETAEDDEQVDTAEADEQIETAEAGNETLFNQENLDLVMDSNKLFPNTPFVENLVGHSAGDEVSFSFTFPDDFEDEELAGREAWFDLEILGVKSRDLPPLNDELAKLEGNNETLEELRDDLRENLEQQAENQAKEALIESTTDDLLVDADIHFPPAAVELELDEMVDSFKSQIKNSGWEFDDYLKIQGSTEQSIRADFRESAEKRLTRRIILRQFMLDEKLRVETADVEALVDERVGHYENEELRQQMHDFYLTGQGFDMISSEVLSNKVYERMVAILSGNAPDLDALEALEEEISAGLEEE